MDIDIKGIDKAELLAALSRHGQVTGKAWKYDGCTSARTHRQRRQPRL